MRRVVITGLGPVTPIGIGRRAFWSAVCRGVSGTRRLEALPFGFPVASLQSRIVARIDGLCEDDDGRPRTLRLGELAARLALRDAALPEPALRDAALIAGTAVAATPEMERDYLDMLRGGALQLDGAAPNLFERVAFHSIAHELARSAGCGGPVLTIATGCTAGLDAIGTAFDLIRDGEADVAIAGATEAPITPVVFAAFDVIGALSKHNDRPTVASRPFDANRDGFVLGEGASFLVLEERGHALGRGAHIFAEVTGFASVSNAFHMTDLPADGAALSECLAATLDDAGVAAEAVQHINAHGSSTPQNDVCETNAIKTILGAHAYDITVSSLKGAIGHALSASNAIELAACALAIDGQLLFPTLHLDTPDPRCDLDYVPHRGRPARVRNLVKLSNGFSGIHSGLALRSAP